MYCVNDYICVSCTSNGFKQIYLDQCSGNALYKSTFQSLISSVSFWASFALLDKKPTMLWAIIKKYRVVKREYLSRSPKGKWLFIRNICTFVLSFTGVQITDSNFEPNFYSYCTGITIISRFISFFYTLWYYSKTSTPINGLLMLPMFGALIPVKCDPYLCPFSCCLLT